MRHQSGRRLFFAEVVSFHDVRRRLLALLAMQGQYWGRAPHVDDELLRHGLDVADLMAMLRSATVLRSRTLNFGGYVWTFSGSTLDGHSGIGIVEAWGDRVLLQDLQIQVLIDAANPQRVA